MSDPSEPRVRATLPGGTVVEGTLAARQQDRDGRWWYHVTIPLPAEAVEPIAGQDYRLVPTGGAKRWLLQSLPTPTAERRELVVHRPECWAKGRYTEAVDGVQARLFLREGWATACDGCAPDP